MWGNIPVPWMVWVLLLDEDREPKKVCFTNILWVALLKHAKPKVCPWHMQSDTFPAVLIVVWTATATCGYKVCVYIYTVYIHNVPGNVKCLNLNLMASMDSWIATIKSFKHIRFHLTCTRVSLNSLYWEWSSHLLIRNPCNVLVIPYYWVDDTSPTNGPHISSNQSNCSKLLQDQCPRAPGCDFDQDNELTMSTSITIQRSIDQHGLRRKNHAAWKSQEQHKNNECLEKGTARTFKHGYFFCPFFRENLCTWVHLTMVVTTSQSSGCTMFGRIYR